MLLNAKDKDKDPKSSSLMAHLRKIDEHLGRKGTRFLTGDTMCCFDCELMPRLQHIRVAGKYFADFEIPETLVHLWRYMHHMYRLDAFLQSCPADQDIINHYKLQQVLSLPFTTNRKSFLIFYKCQFDSQLTKITRVRFFTEHEDEETRRIRNSNVHD